MPSRESQLECKYDPTQWLWAIGGDTVEVADLSKEDLEQCVCACLDTLERIKSHSSDIIDAIDDVLSGKQIDPQ